MDSQGRGDACILVDESDNGIAGVVASILLHGEHDFCSLRLKVRIFLLDTRSYPIAAFRKLHLITDIALHVDREGAAIHRNLKVCGIDCEHGIERL